MPDTAALPDLHSLWIGKRLPWVQRLCLCSWIRHGHRVKLWCYEPVEGVPAGASDAESILPNASIMRHRPTGSVALFADRFRYHLLQRQSATWFDADMVLLRPLADTRPYLFGWETSTSICTAVMRLPPGSPVLCDLTRLTDARVPIPAWWTLRQRLRQRFAALRGRHQPGETMKWGSFGPRALTYYLDKRDLADRALPIETFYPIHWDDVSLFLATPDAVSPRLTLTTLAVHLWSSSKMGERKELPPRNSWLGTMCERHDIDAGE